MPLTPAENRTSVPWTVHPLNIVIVWAIYIIYSNGQKSVISLIYTMYPCKLLLLLLLLLLHGSTVLVGPWPPSQPSSSRVLFAHVSFSLWHPSSSGPPSRRPSTLTLVFLHCYFLLECSDVTSLPPFPHSSFPHVPAISVFLFLFLLNMSNSPYNCLTSSFVLLLQYPATHIGPDIFLSTFLSQIHKFFSSFTIKHHASEPYSTTGLIIVLYILIFVVLDMAFDLNRGNTVRVSSRC